MRVLKVITIILAVIIIATIAYTFPTNIKRELDGVIFRLGTSDREYCVPVKIMFDGYLKNTRNGRTYQGDIIINNSKLDVVLLFDKGNRNRSTLADYDFDMDGQRYKLSPIQILRSWLSLYMTIMRIPAIHHTYGLQLTD